MKTDDDKLIIAYIVYGLIIIIIKIAILVWLYKIGYLLHYLIFLVVMGIVSFIVSILTPIEEKSVGKTQNDSDNIDKAAKKIELEINNDKIVQKDASEALKVVENLSVDDKNLDKSETLPSEKQT